MPQKQPTKKSFLGGDSCESRVPSCAVLSCDVLQGGALSHATRQPLKYAGMHACACLNVTLQGDILHNERTVFPRRPALAQNSSKQPRSRSSGSGVFKWWPTFLGKYDEPKNSEATLFLYLIRRFFQFRLEKLFRLIFGARLFFHWKKDKPNKTTETKLNKRTLTSIERRSKQKKKKKMSNALTLVFHFVIFFFRGNV